MENQIATQIILLPCAKQQEQRQLLSRADKPQHQLSLVFDQLAFHLRSIWLFTRSDLKSIVGPSTAFAILHYLGSSSFALDTPQCTAVEHALRILKVIFWTWINLLPFNIDNQRQSIEEDLENKPWRPLPSGRMTQKQAAVLMFTLYPVALLFSIWVGSHLQSLVLIGLGIWYNDLKGADKNWFVRNLINVGGYICFMSGALQIMLRDQTSVELGTSSPDRTLHLLSDTMFTNTTLCAWLIIIGAIILSSVQVHDMYDQAGDKRNGRMTMPLVLGDQLTRWTIAVSCVFWSCSCAYFWSLPVAGLILPLSLGGLVAWRTLSKKTVQQDKTTCKLWSVWLVSIYSLPWAVTLLV